MEIELNDIKRYEIKKLSDGRYKVTFYVSKNVKKLSLVMPMKDLLYLSKNIRNELLQFRHPYNKDIAP